jgi:hypothetical protein
MDQFDPKMTAKTEETIYDGQGGNGFFLINCQSNLSVE